MSFYSTEIKHNGPIYALSDIHGDLFSFIISLRDCARVIQTDNFNPEVIDPNIEIQLNKDICDDDGDYDESLGYRWIGGNAIVVICGDMIDPNRTNKCKKINEKLCSEYPQIEIKLLRFINNINNQATRQGGKIYKLLGNHELSNIIDNGLFKLASRYAFRNDLLLRNYYRGYSRLNIFEVGNIGFNLLFESTCGILIFINDTIFLHAGIDISSNNINKINDLNQYINNPSKHLVSEQNNWLINLYLLNNGNTGPLWNRESSYEKIDTRIMQNQESEYCESRFIPILKKFMNLYAREDIRHIRVVVGHCVQSYSTLANTNNTTMSDLVRRTSQIEIFSNNTIHKGKADLSNNGKIFGITMECQKPDRNTFYKYHIDVGSSRDFDPINEIRFRTIDTNLSLIDREKKYFYSRTPQILFINARYLDESEYDPEAGDLIIGNNDNDNIYIIKSTMKNTRIHLPREKYEAMINKYQFFNSLRLNSGNYNKKYLKYKIKYLRLKSNHI